MPWASFWCRTNGRLRAWLRRSSRPTGNGAVVCRVSCVDNLCAIDDPQWCLSTERKHADRLPRVSTRDQNLDLQRDALIQAGCERVFEEHASGARDDRPELAAALSHLRPGDVLVVYKLDRLGRTLRSLIKGSPHDLFKIVR